VLEQAVAGEMRGSPSDAAGSRRPLDNSVEDTR